MITKHNASKSIPADAILVECINSILPKIPKGEHCYATEHSDYRDRYNVWLKDGTKVTSTGYYKERFRVVNIEKVPDIGLHLPN